MVDEVAGCSRDLCHLSSDGIMIKVLASFLWEAQAMAYIEERKLDSVMIEKNIFTGKWDVLDLS